MLNELSRNRLVAIWFSAVAVVAAAVVSLGVNVAAGTTVFLLGLSLVPPAIVFILWRGRPSPTVAEILHPANTPKDGRS